MLVHPNFDDELANGVAVTKNPFDPNFPGFFVNVQVGESLITNPDPTAIPDELLISAIGPNGEFETQFIRHSSLVAAGESVLTDAQIDALTEVMEIIQSPLQGALRGPGRPGVRDGHRVQGRRRRRARRQAGAALGGLTTGGVTTAFARFVERERRADRFAGASDSVEAGEVSDALVVSDRDATRLARLAAWRAAGLPNPGKRTEIVWVDGDSELAVGVARLRVETGDGFVLFSIPVRCDQTGAAIAHVTLAVGARGRPAGLYAAAHPRPRGPALVVDTWGDALVAFAWQVVLELVVGLAAAAGEDARGSRLVPASMEAAENRLTVLPMGRHRL